ncbi:MAG TPA: GNAT family N-acetyltransferase [Gaiellaceae bacterium]|nr:GNAT family N-acetyltransferase [Gaiellaceae bacterium]
MAVRGERDTGRRGRRSASPRRPRSLRRRRPAVRAWSGSREPARRTGRGAAGRGRGEGEQPEPSVPIEPFREEEARAVHAALEETFEDHWENHPRPFEQWWEQQSGWVGYDPSLWFAVRDGDEIAAAVINDINPTAGGHVGVLGVPRAWRGRGYGRALLLHSFREFRRRGARRATLGVDAASPTGATHLYESVGMHLDQEEIVWEKALQ